MPDRRDVLTCRPLVPAGPSHFSGSGGRSCQTREHMRKHLLLVLLTAVLTACSLAHLGATLASAGSEPAADLSGRWTGRWTGTGLLMSPREDDITLDLVQVGDVAYGRFVIDGATA